MSKIVCIQFEKVLTMQDPWEWVLSKTGRRFLWKETQELMKGPLWFGTNSQVREQARLMEGLSLSVWNESMAYNAGVKQGIQNLINSGYTVLVYSSAPIELLQKAQEDLGFHRIICNRMLCKAHDGLSGDIIGPCVEPDDTRWLIETLYEVSHPKIFVWVDQSGVRARRSGSETYFPLQELESSVRAIESIPCEPW